MKKLLMLGVAGAMLAAAPATAAPSVFSIGSGPTASGTLTIDNAINTGAATFLSAIMGSNPSQALGIVPVRGVPEQSTWAMMLIGFGAIGVALRRRRKAISAPA